MAAGAGELLKLIVPPELARLGDANYPTIARRTAWRDDYSIAESNCTARDGDAWQQATTIMTRGAWAGGDVSGLFVALKMFASSPLCYDFVSFSLFDYNLFEMS